MLFEICLQSTANKKNTCGDKIRWRWCRDSRNSVECEFQLAKKERETMAADITVENRSLWTEHFQICLASGFYSLILLLFNTYWHTQHNISFRTHRNLMSTLYTKYLLGFCQFSEFGMPLKEFFFQCLCVRSMTNRQRNSLIQNPLKVLRSKYLYDEQKWNLMLFQMAMRASIPIWKLWGCWKTMKNPFDWMRCVVLGR